MSPTGLLSYPLDGSNKVEVEADMYSVVLMAALARLREAPPENPAPARFTIPAPEQTTFAPGPPWGSPLAVSPDGRRLVFGAIGKDGRRVKVAPPS